MATYSARDLTLVPNIDFRFVDGYIKEVKKSSGSTTVDRGFKYFSEGYVHELSVQLVDNKPIVQLEGKCYDSQRKNMTPNKISIQFASTTESTVKMATCSCPIGKTGACGHVVAILYQLAKYKVLDTRALPEDIAKTSLPQTSTK